MQCLQEEKEEEEVDDYVVNLKISSNVRLHIYLFADVVIDV